jgi:hypothetical protein
MNKDKDYNYIAKYIAKSLTESSIIDENEIAKKIKYILKAALTYKPGERHLSELQIRLFRQTKALQRVYIERDFWKNKLKNKEEYFNELHELLKNKGL